MFVNFEIIFDILVKFFCFMGKVVIERCNYSSCRSWGPEGMVSGDSVCVYRVALVQWHVDGTSQSHRSSV